MQDKVYTYIANQGKPCSTEEIFTHLFNTKSKNTLIPAERILESLLKNDNRFEKLETGFWKILKTLDGKENLVRFSDRTYVVLDFETTGSAPPKDRITEIGAVKIVNGKFVDTFESLINPEKKIPYNVQRIVGITNEMVKDSPKIEDVLPNFLEWIGEDSVLVAHNSDFDLMFLDFEVENLTGEVLANDSICTLRIARKLLRGLKQKGLLAISEHFGIKLKHHRALEDATATAKILLRFFEMLPNANIYDFHSLVNFQKPAVRKLNPEKLHYNRTMVRFFPEVPGVYFFKDKNDKTIYIGKAKNLKHRVNSYFYQNQGHSEKVKSLVQNTYRIEYEILGSELEALLLESELIKKNQPLYNYQIKNYTNLPFLKIDLDNDFPRILITQKISPDKGMYFGPFRQLRNLERILDEIHRSFLVRQCEEDLNPKEDFEACFFFHLKQCEAPCNLSVSKERYNETLVELIDFLKSKTKQPIEKLIEVRDNAAKKLDFEYAQKTQNRIESLELINKSRHLLSRELIENNFLIILPSVNPREIKIFVVLSGKLKNIFSFFQKKSKITLIENFLDKEFYNREAGIRIPFDKDELDKVRILSHWLNVSSNKGSLIDLNKVRRTKLREKLKSKIADALLVKDLE
ncbi:MAG: hypothetical protein DWQ06_14370 [Calditrichaeota bacterium]|nr:MAG: hypothetical protein DWQ06_14370 [Calditrichota bacterium]